jgi:hypothetical protein
MQSKTFLGHFWDTFGPGTAPKRVLWGRAKTVKNGDFSTFAQVMVQ